ncbi:hypothetical protein [Flagellimonas sp.]|uniref:hypothetical protein n=1 Tax=Flagellimonas sp. TaxID=2058762 RepID=UPI003B51E029
MIYPFKLANQIQNSNDFKQVIWSNYLEHSNGITMKEYAAKEMEILSFGIYGVEEYHLKVKEYIIFLERII